MAKTADIIIEIGKNCADHVIKCYEQIQKLPVRDDWIRGGAARGGSEVQSPPDRAGYVGSGSKAPRKLNRGYTPLY